MTQKIFVKLEKSLACDLKPGDLFTTTAPDEFGIEMSDIAVVIMLKTNEIPESDTDDTMVVHKIHVAIVDRETPAPPKLDPHAPPGFKQ
jgi:hypothetical protein